MPRPTNKEDLLAVSSQRFAALFDLIEAMPSREQSAEFLFEDRDRNVRDVLVHLYEWHILLITWIEGNRHGQGGPRSFLPEPYNWRTYPQMNVEIWEKHQTTSLKDAKSLLRHSHEEVLRLIQSFSQDELFTKRFFSWTGGSTLGSYCVSSTSSHYDWAIKKLKSHGKTYGRYLKDV